MDGRRPGPMRSRPAPRNYDECQAIIDKWLKQGVIKEATAPVRASHPVHLHVLERGDGVRKLRLVVSYDQGINRCLHKTSFESKPIDESLHILSSGRYKSQIDIRQMYHQLQASEEAKQHLAISWAGKTYLPERVLFGVSDAPSFAVSILNGHVLHEILQQPAVSPFHRADFKVSVR